MSFRERIASILHKTTASKMPLRVKISRYNLKLKNALRSEEGPKWDKFASVIRTDRNYLVQRREYLGEKGREVEFRIVEKEKPKEEIAHLGVRFNDGKAELRNADTKKQYRHLGMQNFLIKLAEQEVRNQSIETLSTRASMDGFGLYARNRFRRKEGEANLLEKRVSGTERKSKRIITFEERAAKKKAKKRILNPKRHNTKQVVIDG